MISQSSLQHPADSDTASGRLWQSIPFRRHWSEGGLAIPEEGASVVVGCAKATMHKVFDGNTGVCPGEAFKMIPGFSSKRICHLCTACDTCLKMAGLLANSYMIRPGIQCYSF